MPTATLGESFNTGSPPMPAPIPALLDAHFSTSPLTLLGIFAVLTVAYALFSLVGFGTALIAATPLAWAMPVTRVVPLLALLDATSAVQRGYTLRRQVDRPALLRLVPGMALGQATGVALLSVLPVSLMAALLGGFVMAYGAWSLRGGGSGGWPSSGGAWLWGIGGGLLGGMFGSGGFVYAAYLQPRLPDRDAFRATQAVLISLSTLWRAALCAASGLVDGPLLLTALVLLPATHLGKHIAGQVDRRLSVEDFRRVLDGLLIASGLALVWRASGDQLAAA